MGCCSIHYNVMRTLYSTDLVPEFPISLSTFLRAGIWHFAARKWETICSDNCAFKALAKLHRVRALHHNNYVLTSWVTCWVTNCGGSITPGGPQFARNRTTREKSQPINMSAVWGVHVMPSYRLMHFLPHSLPCLVFSASYGQSDIKS